MKSVISASERVFRIYHSHCVNPSADTLFNLFNAIHSLNEKLDKAGLGGFYDIKEFAAIKALRNLFHHQEELANKLRIIPLWDFPSITTDLIFLCLVPGNLVEDAILTISKKYRAIEESVIKSVLNWHGTVVNINPCIFNFMVKAFEYIESKELCLSGSEYLSFASSYEFEAENGHSHFVTGAIICYCSDVDEVIKKTFESVGW